MLGEPQKDIQKVLKKRKFSKKVMMFILGGTFLAIISICCTFSSAKRGSCKELYYSLDWVRTVEKIVRTDAIIREYKVSNYRFEDFKVRTANPYLERDRDWVGGRSLVAVVACDYGVDNGNVQDTCIFELFVNVEVKTNPGRLFFAPPKVEEVKLKSGNKLPKDVEDALKKDIEDTWGGDVKLNDLAEKDNRQLLSGECKLRKDGVILRIGEE